MKYIALIGVLVFTFVSCSNEFDITEDRKDIPVVYGLLNPMDTATYLRIEKAFISDDISALEIAQIPDSLYYDDLDARLVDLETEEEFILNRVDGNAEGYVRDQGIFAVAPNYLYKINANEFTPEPGKQYELRLERGDDLETVTAMTTVIQNPIVISPATSSDISFRNGFETFFEWRYVNTDDEESIGKVFDLFLELKYSEAIDNNPFVSKKVVWKVSTNLTPDGNNNAYSIPVQGQRFFNTMASAIEENPLAIRSFGNIDVVVVGGGQEILDFLSVGQANLGITSSQDIPTYTNISDGLGLFSSRNEIRKNSFSITSETLDSLRFGSVTKNLNFQ